MPREKHYWYMKELKAIHVYTKSPLPPQKSISPPQEHKQSLEITASSSCQNQKTNSMKRKILHLFRYSCFTFIHLRIHRKKKKQAGQVT